MLIKMSGVIRVLSMSTPVSSYFCDMLCSNGGDIAGLHDQLHKALGIRLYSRIFPLFKTHMSHRLHSSVEAKYSYDKP